MENRPQHRASTPGSWPARTCSALSSFWWPRSQQPGPEAVLQFCAHKAWGLLWGLSGQQAHGLRTPESHGGGSQQVSEVP